MKKGIIVNRCIVDYNHHVKELELYTKDVEAISKAFSPHKINYDTYEYSVPKYEGGTSWGQAFATSPNDKLFLRDGEYRYYK